MSSVRLACWSVVSLLALPLVARGQLFNINASSDTTTVRDGGNSLVSLVENLSGTEARFAPLNGQAFSSTVNYAGLPNAIRLTQSFDAAGNRVVNFAVPSVGVNRTFSAADGSLSQQVRDYLKKEGLADLTAFQSVVARRTAVGVVDGNPLAADMLLADAGYQQFALHVSPLETDGVRFGQPSSASQPADDGDGHVVSRYWTNAGVLDAGGSTGQYVDLTLATEFHFNDTIALSLTTPLRFHTIKSADVFMGGEVVGLPITILPAKGGTFFWQVTPAGHAALVGSQDLVSGGLLYGGQVDNSVGAYLGGGFTVTVANEVGYFRGADVEVAGYHFNTRLDQWQFKNGLQLQKNFAGVTLDVSGTWTNFLRDTFTDGYFTPEVGLGVKFNKYAGLRVGYAGHFGNGYNTNGGNILLYFTN